MRLMLYILALGMLCALGSAQPSGYGDSGSMSASYSATYPSMYYDWLSPGYSPYYYYTYYYYPYMYYYPYNYYPYRYYYYPYYWYPRYYRYWY